MKTTHFLCSLLTALVLFGCGGSDLSNSDLSNAASVANSPSVSPSSALAASVPVITGVSSVGLLATQAQRIEFPVNHSDINGSKLSVSVSGVESWAEAHLSNSHLDNTHLNSKSVVVNLTPGFFDLGEHTLKITVSDGQADAVHEVNLQVADNPEAYQAIELNTDVMKGHWAFDDGSELHLYADARGLYKTASEDSYYPVSWSIPESNKAHIIVNQQHCGTCWMPHDAFAIEFVAQKDKQIRARFTEGGKVKAVSNGVATDGSRTLAGDNTHFQFASLHSDRQLFTYLGANSRNRASYLDNATKAFSIVTPVAGQTNSDSHWPEAKLTGTFSVHDNQLKFSPDSTSHALTHVFKRFEQAQTGSLDGFYFNYSLSSLESRFTSPSLRVLQAVLKPQLDVRHNSAVVTDYPQMSEFLSQELTVWVELQPLVPVDNSELKMGMSYYSEFKYDSQFEYAERAFDLFNVNQLVLDSPTKGRFIIDSAHEPAMPVSASVDVAMSGNVIELSQGESNHKSTHRYGLYRNAKGDLLSVWLDNDNMTVVPVAEKTTLAQETSFSALTEQLLLVNGRGIHEQNERFLKYTPSDATAGYRADIHKTKELADNSLLMAMSLGSNIQLLCDGLNFNDCIAQEQEQFLETPDRPFVQRRLKLISVQGDRYFLQNNETFFIDGYMFSSGQLLEMVRLSL